MDIEQRLQEAADAVRKAAEGFDGDEFSRRLFEKLGIAHASQPESPNYDDPIVRTVETSYGCPSQWDAWTASGVYMHLRFRYGRGTVEIHTPGDFNGPMTELASFLDEDDMAGVISFPEFARRANLTVDVHVVHE